MKVQGHGAASVLALLVDAQRSEPLAGFVDLAP